MVDSPVRVRRAWKARSCESELRQAQQSGTWLFLHNFLRECVHRPYPDLLSSMSDDTSRIWVSCAVDDYEIFRPSRPSRGGGKLHSAILDVRAIDQEKKRDRLCVQALLLA